MDQSRVNESDSGHTPVLPKSAKAETGKRYTKPSARKRRRYRSCTPISSRSSSSSKINTKQRRRKQRRKSSQNERAGLDGKYRHKRPEIRSYHRRRYDSSSSVEASTSRCTSATIGTEV